MVGVAQLAERLTVDQKVAGSRPVAHPAYLDLSLGRRVFLVYMGVLDGGFLLNSRTMVQIGAVEFD